MAALLAVGVVHISVQPASALSEIKREEIPQPSDTPAQPSDDQSIEKKSLPPLNQVPSPDSTTTAPGLGEPDKAGPGKSEPDQSQPDEADPGGEGPPDSARLAIDPNAPIPEIVYDLGKLPEPVRRLHDRIMEATKSGDIEKLRPLLEPGESGTQLSFGAIEGDPIDYLKELSGDKEGAEILAILEDVLSAGFVHMDAGTPNDMYVWPYFFAVPLEKLTPAQKVELFRIVTSGDYDEMKTYGTYIFYRVGITPEGRWSFFVAGD
ncbi:hypothetical protein SAZ10_05515 [Mesorhizobium sp. BAC0120]|nr:hypothetical protein [Mesorhizobium sp. BAC0120]MDW6021220.1 hypothetical protein [Mesorhizobium sp. BAC0120]